VDASDSRRGCLLVFEGIDGSGKTTTKARVAEVLRRRGFDVIELFEPTDGPHGRQIRHLARSGRARLSVDEELELFVQDRLENVEENIRPALARGAVVLLDRYYFSTMAYQGARGVDVESIRHRNEEFAPRPDRVLYFRVSVDEALRRIKRARGGMTDVFEKRDYLERVRALFDKFAERYEFFHTIDAEAGEDDVLAEALRAIESCLPEPNATSPEEYPDS
jgi:dTMP kinase